MCKHAKRTLGTTRSRYWISTKLISLSLIDTSSLVPSMHAARATSTIICKPQWGLLRCLKEESKGKTHGDVYFGGNFVLWGILNSHKGPVIRRWKQIVINILQCNPYELKRQLSKIWGLVKIILHFRRLGGIIFPNS